MRIGTAGDSAVQAACRRFGGASADREEVSAGMSGTWNMADMSVTRDVSKLSGWLKPTDDPVCAEGRKRGTLRWRAAGRGGGRRGRRRGRQRCTGENDTRAHRLQSGEKGAGEGEPRTWRAYW